MNGRPVITKDKTVVWLARPSANRQYLAVFNAAPDAQKLHLDWKDLGLEATQYQIRDLWSTKILARRGR